MELSDHPARTARTPNEALARLIEASGMSHHALARRVNDLAEQAGIASSYTHTSVVNWTRRGMVPRPPIPAFIAQVLAEPLGRPVDPAEIGMAQAGQSADRVGLDFHRDVHQAVHTATRFWSTVHRRTFVTSAFAVGAYSTPVTRWLAVPTDADAAHRGRNRVGRQDLEALWTAAAAAQRSDSKYGGGTRTASTAAAFLNERAIPLLHADCTDAVGKELFAGTAELARVAGWSALDMGHHALAQRHFIQALRMARAAGRLDIGCHVLTNMALQTILRGYPDEAVDMVQGAYDRARHVAAPRVLAFAKLIEARAHAGLGDARSAAGALASSEQLLERADTGQGDEPAWISYYTPARMAADAVEIHRDLGLPVAALRWNNRATPMSTNDFTRSVGLRMTVLATAHLQNRDLDQALAHGQRAVIILSRVRSTRATDYLAGVVRAMAPWHRDPRVIDLSRRAHQAITFSANSVAI
ncbi:sporulation protein [Streptomyces sp. MBT53]|uniref:sporulation protein n=1 Tax=Streptomyces sp. MBT53 TaxID=1488384 RepID=UPI001911D30C|nr:sporulation protein [Streptomyces sp. MBT53]MBK6013545.1 sporulation protein [Streptomyces sp. MBT53]